jgi:uncharacterized protein (DUF58 family)
MSDAIHQLLTRYGPQLAPMAALLILLLISPLILLAWARRTYPHTPALVLLALPPLLSFALLYAPWQQTLVPIILLLDVVIPAVAFVDLWTLAGLRTFKIERQASRVASIRKNHRITLHITSVSRVRRAAWIRDDLPPEFAATPQEFLLLLGPLSRTTIHYDVKAARRGAFVLPRVHLRVRSFLGLWRRFLSYPMETTIHVYPDMKQIAEYAILARTNRLSLMGVRRTRKVGTENDFERLRDYTPDDDYKYIDWRATARRSKLTVKDFQTSQSQRIIFLLDCGRMMTNLAGGISLLDHALNASLMLSYVALRQGDSVGMIAFADRVLSFVPPRGGMNQMNQLLHASFDRFPELVESRYDDVFLYLGRPVQQPDRRGQQPPGAELPGERRRPAFAAGRAAAGPSPVRGSRRSAAVGCRSLSRRRGRGNPHLAAPGAARPRAPGSAGAGPVSGGHDGKAGEQVFGGEG